MCQPGFPCMSVAANLIPAILVPVILIQVLDYQNCAATLLPLIASSYALYFMGEAMMGMYRQFEKDRDRGEFGALPELHALSSGLKVGQGRVCRDCLCLGFVH